MENVHSMAAHRQPRSQLGRMPRLGLPFFVPFPLTTRKKSCLSRNAIDRSQNHDTSSLHKRRHSQDKDFSHSGPSSNKVKTIFHLNDGYNRCCHSKDREWKRKGKGKIKGKEEHIKALHRQKGLSSIGNKKRKLDSKDTVFYRNESNLQVREASLRHSLCVTRRQRLMHPDDTSERVDSKPTNINDIESSQFHVVCKSSWMPKKCSFDGDDNTEGALEIRESLGKKCKYNDQHANMELDQANNVYKAQKDRTDSVGKHLSTNACETISKEDLFPEFSNLQLLRVSSNPLPKQLEKGISEAEQAIKKELAARRRKQELERNVKVIQANAIQKILGQDSSRKRREEKCLKMRKEMEKGKQLALGAPPVNTIRWVMGPSGNVVSFSKDVEMLRIFPAPCCYPPAREKCAGPSCNNVYKYRDSKTRLPLCSLQCYKAVQIHSTILFT